MTSAKVTVGDDAGDAARETSNSKVAGGALSSMLFKKRVMRRTTPCGRVYVRDVGRGDEVTDGD